MCRQLGFEVGDLAIQFGDDRDRGASGRPKRGSDHRRGDELLATQRRLDLQCPRVEIALPSSGFECRPDLRDAQSCGLCRVGARPKTARASRSDRDSKASNAAG